MRRPRLCRLCLFPFLSLSRHRRDLRGCRIRHVHQKTYQSAIKKCGDIRRFTFLFLLGHTCPHCLRVGILQGPPRYGCQVNIKYENVDKMTQHQIVSQLRLTNVNIRRANSMALPRAFEWPQREGTISLFVRHPHSLSLLETPGGCTERPAWRSNAKNRGGLFFKHRQVHF